MSGMLSFISLMNGMAITVSQGAPMIPPSPTSKKNYLTVEPYRPGDSRQIFQIVRSPPTSGPQANNPEIYAIKSCATNKYIDIEGASDKIFTPALIYDKGNNFVNNQLFFIKSVQDPIGGCYLEALHSRQVLQIQAGIDVNGMPIVQNTPYTWNRNQRWELRSMDRNRPEGKSSASYGYPSSTQYGYQNVETPNSPQGFIRKY